MVLLILLTVVFIVLSGLMAAVDAAVLSVTSPEVHELVLQRRRGAQALRAIKGELTRAVVVIVVLTNAINVLGPIIVSRQAVDVYGAHVLVVVMVALTLGTIVFSEIIPKAIGARYAPGISRIAASPIRMLQRMMLPLVLSLEWLSSLFASGSRRIDPFGNPIIVSLSCSPASSSSPIGVSK